MYELWGQLTSSICGTRMRVRIDCHLEAEGIFCPYELRSVAFLHPIFRCVWQAFPNALHHYHQPPYPL